MYILHVPGSLQGVYSQHGASGSAALLDFIKLHKRTLPDRTNSSFWRGVNGIGVPLTIIPATSVLCSLDVHQNHFR